MTVTRSGKTTKPEGEGAAEPGSNQEDTPDFLDLDVKDPGNDNSAPTDEINRKEENSPHVNGVGGDGGGDKQEEATKQGKDVEMKDPAPSADASVEPEGKTVDATKEGKDAEEKDEKDVEMKDTAPAKDADTNDDTLEVFEDKDQDRKRERRASRERDGRDRKRSRDRHKSRDRDRSKERSHKRSRDDRSKDRLTSRRSRSRGKSARRSRSRGKSSRRSRSRGKSARRHGSRDRKPSRRERSRSRDRKSRRRSSSRSRRRSPSRRRSRSRRRRSPSRSYRRSSPYRRRRSRSRDFGMFRGHRRGDGSEEEGFGGYVPRKRQEAPMPGSGYSAAFIDPYAALRSKKPLPTDPEGIKRSMREQQLAARQMVLQQQASSAVAAASKTQREIYVGNLVQGLVTEDSLRQLFNSTMKAAFPDGGRTPGEPCTSVSMHSEGRYAFVELKSAEMASAALQLSGQVQLLGQNISVGRPSGYVDPSAAQMSAAQAATALQAFQAGTLTLEQAEEAMNSIHMPGVQSSSEPPEASPGQATLALPPPPGAPPGGVSPGGPTPGLPGPPAGMGGPPPPMMGGPPAGFVPPAAPHGGPPAGFVSPGGSPSPFLQVEGMVTADVLKDDEEYAEVIEDLRDECGKYGQILQIVIPRPQAAMAHQLFGTHNFGKAFVQFADVNAAVQSKNAIHGRLFLGATIQAQFISHPEFMAAQQ